MLLIIVVLVLLLLCAVWATSIAAERDPTCDGFAAEIAATRALYDDPEARRKVSEFLTKSST